MRLEEYFIKFPTAKSTYSNKKFLEEVFYPLYGERGLDKLLNEEPFIDEEKNPLLNVVYHFVLSKVNPSLNPIF